MARIRKNGFAALGALVLAAAIAVPVLASAHSASGSGLTGHMGMGMGMGMDMGAGPMQGCVGATPDADGAPGADGSE